MAFASFHLGTHRRPGLLVLCLGWLATLSAAATAAAPQARLDDRHREFLAKHCIACHGEKEQEGEVRLDRIGFTVDSVATADLWQKVLNQLNSGEMPPEDAPQPEAAIKAEFLDALARTLVTARKVLADVQGTITMRRLNRREYKNTIRELLGVDVRVNELPADSGAGTFDTVGSSLFMSSDQFEQYLGLGRQALDEHFARFVAPAKPKPRRMRVEVEEKNDRIAKALAERLDDRQRYERWTAAVEAAAAKPENTAVVAKIRAEKPRDATHLQDQWRQIAGAPDPAAFGFVDAVRAEQMGRRDWEHYVPHHRAYVDHPLTKTGVFLTVEDMHVNPYQAFRMPSDWPAGDYVVRVRVAATDSTPASRHFLELGSQHDTGVRAVISSHQVTGTIENPQVLEIPLKFNPAGGRGFFFQERGSYESDTAARVIFEEAKRRNGVGPEFALWIDWIEIEGAAAGQPAPVAASGTKPQKLRREPEEFANKQVSGWAAGFQQNFDRYKQWTAAIDVAAALPENEALAAELRGLDRVKRHPPYFYSEWMKRKEEPSPTKFGFRDVDDAQFAKTGFDQHFRYHNDYLAQPHRDTGTYLTIYNVHEMELIKAHAAWPPGTYIVRLRIAALDDAPKERRFIEVFQRGQVSTDLTVLGSHQILGTMAQPQVLEIPVTVSATGNREFAIRERQPNARSAAFDIWNESLKKTGTGPKPALWIDWIEIEGPVTGPGSGSAASPAKPQKLRKDPETWANKYMPIYADGYVEKFGRYQTWCAAVDAVGDKPENVAAVEKLRADPRLKTQPHLFYNGYAQIPGAPPPTEFGFKDVEDAQFARSEHSYHHRYYADYAKLPHRETGSYLMLYSLGRYTGITAPPHWPAGRYLLRIRLAATDESPAERRFIEIGTGKADAADFNVASSHQVVGTLASPQVLELPVEVNASGDRTFTIRDKRPNSRDAEYAMFREAWDKTGTGPRPCIWIDWVELEGPLTSMASAETVPVPKATRIEPETRRAEVERGHLRFKFLNEQYAKWQAAGGDEAKLKDFSFTDKAHADFAKHVWEQNHRWFQQYLDRPLSKTGLYLDNTVQETCEYAVDLPTDLASGDYVMRVRIGRVPDMPPERAFLTFVEASPIDKDDRTFLANTQITAPLEQPEVVELPFKIRPGGPRKFVLMEKRPLKKEGISLPGRTRQIADAKRRDPALWIDWIEWQGPLPAAGGPATVPPILVTTDGPPERQAARTAIESFAVRAFRDRRPSEDFIERLLTIFDARRATGEPFETAIRSPLSVILASPGFLYLAEPRSGEKPQRLDATELAARLSYFLWSGPPDEQLLAAARSGELLQPPVLAREVDRLIDDPRSDEFVRGFVHQWLDMQRLDFFQFDTRLFRDFDESTKAAARREVYESFAHLLRHNESLGELLASDHVFVNGLLASYYGIEGVSGDDFQRVRVPAGSPRGGLLGMAAILAMGSNGERTSPVERGAWVLRYLLHDPPPPAPKNVPQLDRLAGKPISPRERLAAHQEQPQCASCHRRIDPIGFGLEHFDAAGRWREVDVDPKTKRQWPIDPAGSFHEGPSFTSYFELRDLVAARRADFARGFAEKLVEYALGRPCGFTDEDLVATMVQSAQARDFAVRQFIHAVVASREFQSK
jgi:hypothetical protein